MSYLIPDSHLDITEVTDLIVSDSNEEKLNSRLLSFSSESGGDIFDGGNDGGMRDDDDGNDIFQSTQVKLIQIPSNANVIQVPSNLLVTSNQNNLILCLPSEGINFQVQQQQLSTSPIDSSMETNIHEIYDTSNCNQSSFATLTPITFTEIIQHKQLTIPTIITTPTTPTTAFGETTIEVSPEIQLEKAQTWHKDSQLAIVALAALKATNKLTQLENAI